MRLTSILVLVGLAAFAVAADPAEERLYGQKKYFKVADKDFISKQTGILRLFRYVNQPAYYKDLSDAAKSYSVEKNANAYTKPEAVKQFLYYYRNGMLPRDEIFSEFNDEQLEQAIALFKLFYYAKDYPTFYNTAVWARSYVNQGMYLYALSVAVLQRPDTYGVALPPIYEIYPFYFYNSEVIQKTQDYKQQYSGITEKQTYNIQANYSGWYLNVNPEQSLAYFTEDVGINAYYYYYNLYRPFWLNAEEFKINSYYRGEEFYFFYQQLIARYYLERLSNGFGDVENYDYQQPIKTGYTPSMRYPNGLDFPSRPSGINLFRDYFNYAQSYNFDGKFGYSYTYVQDYERRIRDAIDAGYVYTPDGKKIDLYEPEGFNTLGNIIEANPQSPNSRFYGYLQFFARYLLGYTYQPMDKYRLAPSALEHFETSMRDPMFWSFYKRITQYCQTYKYNLPRYNYSDITYPGVKIQNMEVDRLVTYFDLFDADLSNAVYFKEQEFDSSSFDVRARQYRLNHKPFTYKLTVSSEQAGPATVRVFLGPKYDEYDRPININANRMNFVELDKFKYDLQAGQNMITRNSQEFFYSQDYPTYNVMYNQVNSAMNGANQYKVYGSEMYYTFPSRYMLPKGAKGGQTFQFYVLVSPYKPPMKYDAQNYYYPVVGLGSQYMDGYALGYPFDRPIKESSFQVPNAYFQDAVIYFSNVEDVKVAAQKS